MIIVTPSLLKSSVFKSSQSRSQSFVPLDQRSENESSGSIRFKITIENSRILVIRFTAQSQTASMACYGACLKWLLPELSFSNRWSRERSSGTRLKSSPLKLACSRLSVSGVDRKSRRMTSGTSGIPLSLPDPARRTSPGRIR